MQAKLADKAAELATAQEQHAASDADWESRMKDAVSSAEQWKEFAEKLGAEKETLQSTLASTELMLAVGSYLRSSCAYWINISHALEVLMSHILRHTQAITCRTSRQASSAAGLYAAYLLLLDTETQKPKVLIQSLLLHALSQLLSIED